MSEIYYFFNFKANISVGFKETQDEEGHGGLSGGTTNRFFTDFSVRFLYILLYILYNVKKWVPCLVWGSVQARND